MLCFVDRCLSFFFWPLYCLSIFDLPFWLPHWYFLAIVLSVHLQFTALITPLISFGHCIVCPSSIYHLITPLISFGHCIVCPSSIYRFDYLFDIFWPLYCLSIFDLPLWLPFCIFWPLYCLSIFNFPFWLHLWYLLATLLFVHLQFTVFITPLISFSHSVVCPSSIYRFYYPFDIFWPLYCLSIFNLPFWLPLWYLFATLLSVHLKFTVFIIPLVSSNFSSYARACSLYSKILKRHHILSNKLLNRWFLKNRFIFQNILQISTPCWKAFCQLCTGDENGIGNYILI